MAAASITETLSRKLSGMTFGIDLAEKAIDLLKQLVDNTGRIADELAKANEARQHRDHVHAVTDLIRAGAKK